MNFTNVKRTNISYRFHPFWTHKLHRVLQPVVQNQWQTLQQEAQCCEGKENVHPSGSVFAGLRFSSPVWNGVKIVVVFSTPVRSSLRTSSNTRFLVFTFYFATFLKRRFAFGPSNKLPTDSHQQRLSVNMMWPNWKANAVAHMCCKQLHLASWQIMAKVRAETTCAAIEQCMEWPLAKLINFSV